MGDVKALEAEQLDLSSVDAEEMETLKRHLRADSVLLKRDAGTFSYSYQTGEIKN
ncbi:hypothetical protein [Bacillus sp. JCM 19041]|uniref:hypothetical protein n=1 Tax=Bacillus sp. JCM 19041 TaxID=1460637 RepID=UPI000AA76E2B